MRKKMIFVNLLTVFLMMLPAVEYNTVIEVNESRFFEEIQNMNSDELKEKILNMNVEDEDLKEFQKQFNDDSASPQCIRIALRLICMLPHIFVKILLLPLKIMLILLKILFQNNNCWKNTIIKNDEGFRQKYGVKSVTNWYLLII